MDKKTLNNEIVLCRAAVRKAKVAVIRKIIKKMKILKTCKVEAVKEKKLKKSERLFKKVQIMKRVKVDEVTKFALRNSNLEVFLKGPKFDLQQNALACLAQHDAIMKKVKSIREQIPNWETELPNLLDSLGRKNKKKFDRRKEPIKTNSNSKSDEKIVKKGKTKENVKNVKSPQLESATASKRTQAKPNKKQNIESDNADSESEESDSSVTENISDSSPKVEKIEKIVDPFFIGKKVIAPKLVLERLSQETNENKIDKFRKPKLERETRSSLFHTKPFRSKKDSDKFKPQVSLTKAPDEENLHPSWAAKKVKLIKPFQGKKIKFSDD